MSLRDRFAYRFICVISVLFSEEFSMDGAHHSLH
jgi:hypothetical protein